MKKNMKPNNGEVPVAIVRIKPSFTIQQVDFTDYTNPRITAVIPCWKNSNGKYFAVEDGRPVTMKDTDEERLILCGTAFRYPDGEEILLTRNSRGERFFVKKEIKTCILRPAFGE